MIRVLFVVLACNDLLMPAVSANAASANAVFAILYFFVCPSVRLSATIVSPTKRPDIWSFFHHMAVHAFQHSAPHSSNFEAKF